MRTADPAIRRGRSDWTSKSLGWDLWGVLAHLLPQETAAGYASDPSGTIHLCCRSLTLATRS